MAKSFFPGFPTPISPNTVQRCKPNKKQASLLNANTSYNIQKMPMRTKKKKKRKRKLRKMQNHLLKKYKKH